MTNNPKQIVFLGLAVGLLLLALIWRQRSDIESLKREYGRLAEQKLTLETSLRQNAGAGTAVTSVPQQDSSQRSSISEASVLPGASQVGQTSPAHAVSEPNNLALNSVSTRQQGDGITATMVFKPTTTNAIDDVWVVVRLPRDSGVKILDIAPADSTQYTNVGKRVTEEGNFAIFQGKPLTVNPLKFDVSVSGPVTASVRGTCGINRFNLEISAAGAKVRGE